jgi:hypothetical protein
MGAGMSVKNVLLKNPEISVRIRAGIIKSHPPSPSVRGEPVEPLGERMGGGSFDLEFSLGLLGLLS